LAAEAAGRNTEIGRQGAGLQPPALAESAYLKRGHSRNSAIAPCSADELTADYPGRGLQDWGNECPWEGKESLFFLFPIYLLPIQFI
jgi:hypothetical protein